MLRTIIPKRRFTLAEYPNLEIMGIDSPIPIGWGEISNINPTCIDTGEYTFKILDQAILSIDDIRTEKEGLTVGDDYEVDLDNAEFTLYGTPRLNPATTYYFVITGDFAVSGANYLDFYAYAGAHYASGQLFDIDNAGVWTGVAYDLKFRLYGRARITDGPLGPAPEIVIADNFNYFPPYFHAFKDANARTRLGQSFQITPSVPMYVTKILLHFVRVGSPVGNINVTLLSAYNPAEIQIGSVSDDQSVATGGIESLEFPVATDISNIVCDINGPYVGSDVIDNVADIIESMIGDVLEKDTSILDPYYLADLYVRRPQKLKVYIDREMEFGDWVAKLEAGQLFKFIPLQDGTYGTIIFDGELPTDTPHFFDEDFLSFRVIRDLSVVKSKINIKYNEDPLTQEFYVSVADSDMGAFFYRSDEVLEIESYLVEDADATEIAENYATLYSSPQIKVLFEVHGWGLDLIPGRDKVIITRSRACWLNGEFDAVPFRIMRITKKPQTATTEILAVLDSQTYVPEVSGSASGSGA